MDENGLDFKELNLLVRSLDTRIIDIEQVLIGASPPIAVHPDFQKVLDRIRQRMVARNIDPD